MILRKNAYEAFIKSLREKMGSAYEALLYHIGYEVGRNAYKSHEKLLKNIQEALRLGKEVFRHVGFGTLDFEFKDGELVVKVWNSFECELFKNSNKCESHLIRGMISGFVSSAYDRQAMATEIKCIAKGDPYCEYIVQLL